MSGLRHLPSYVHVCTTYVMPQNNLQVKSEACFPLAYV